MKNFKKYTWFIPVFIIISGFVSCDFESEKEIDDIYVPSRLVMNSIILMQNDTNRVYFSDSKSIFSTENSRKALKSESQYWTSWYADPKVYYLPNVQTALYKNDILQPDIYTNSKDSITYYIDKQIKAGDKFKIEANQDGRKISASTTIPIQPQILGVDTIAFYQNNGNIYGQQLRLLIRIKDQPEIKNYYRIFVATDIEVQIDPEYAEYHNLPEKTTLSYKTMNTDDPAITNGTPKNNYNTDFAEMEFMQNYYNIFTDDLFTNSEYTLNVYIPYPSNSGFYSGYSYIEPKYIKSQKIKVTIRLQALSPELYQYYNSLQKFLYHTDDVIEPFRVFNNIEGGIGILGSINQLKYIVYENEVFY